MEQRNRDYQLDNIKGLMIFFVIFVHVFERFYKGWSDNLITKYLYILCISFPMPVFVFISGYLSKRKTDYDTYIVKAIKSCLVPYLVFNILYGLPSIKSALSILSPKWTLWYLLSLFSWKVLSQVFIKVKFIFPIAILLSLYIGLFDSMGAFLSLSRTICFFPFFIAGYLCQPEHIRKIRASKKIYSVLALLVTLVIIWVLTKMNIESSTLFFRSSYDRLGQSYVQGIILRSVILLCGFLCTFGFISIMPENKTILSRFGIYSITVYLGHSLIIRVLEYLDIINITNPFIFILFAIVFSLALCFVLGNQKVSMLYHKFMDKVAATIIANK